MGEVNERNWVWVSSEASRAEGKVSVLAVVETLCCVAAYWVLVLYFGVTWHHWLIVVATPLVLLRSESSIRMSSDWFSNYNQNTNEALSSREITRITIINSTVNILCFSTIPFIVLESYTYIIIFLVIFTIYIYIVVFEDFRIYDYEHFIKDKYSPGDFRYLILKSINIPGVLILLILSLPIRCAIFRFVSTMRCAQEGIFEFPNNWKSQIFSWDFSKSPEMIPENKETSFDRIFDNFDDVGRSLFLMFLLGPTWFLPVLIWRFAIKSTAWFYLPLLWVGRGWQNIRNGALTQWATAYATTKLNWIGTGIAVVCLATSAFAVFLPLEFLALKEKLEAAGAPMSPFGYLMVLDWKAFLVQPWQWFYLPSWLMTLALFLMLDHHAKHVKAGADATKLYGKFRFWMWVGNARTVLTNIGLAVALWYFLDAVDAWGQVKAAWTRLFG